MKLEILINVYCMTMIFYKFKTVTMMNSDKLIKEVVSAAEAGDMKKLEWFSSLDKLKIFQNGYDGPIVHAIEHVLLHGTPKALERLMSFPEGKDKRPRDCFYIAALHLLDGKLKSAEKIEIVLKYTTMPQRGGLNRRLFNAAVEYVLLMDEKDENKAPLKEVLIQYGASVNSAPQKATSRRPAP